MRIVIATGGTGGHIYPALTLADHISRIDADAEIHFIGNDDRMEAIEIPKHGYPFLGIRAKGFNGNSSAKLQSLKLMASSIRLCCNQLEQWKPQIVIGFGGYVTVPVVLAARRLHIPVILHEQNSIAGMANRFLARFAKWVVTCYPEAAAGFPGAKVKLLGNPRASIAKSVVHDRMLLSDYGLEPMRKTVLIVMGSLGSSSVNDVMKQALRLMADRSYQIIYATGKAGYDDFIRDVKETKRIKILPYVDQAVLTANTDLIVSRGGATSAAEITALCRPAIIIPSPYVPNNHQYLNAKAMLEAGCAELLEEKDLTAKRIVAMIDALLDDDQRLADMARCAAKLGFPDAVEHLTALIQETIGESYGSMR